MRLLIFGCGNYGKKALEYLSQEHEVLGFCDNNDAIWGSTVDGYKVFSPDHLKEVSYPVVVAIPSNYDQVIDQIRSYGIEDIFLFQLFYISRTLELKYKLIDLNRKKKARDKKRILFISYLFPPTAGGGVMRALKFARYLPEFGYDVSVLTSGNIDYLKHGLDKSLLTEVADTDIHYVCEEPVIPGLIGEQERSEIIDLYRYVMDSDGWMAEYEEAVKNGVRQFLPDEELVWVNRCIKYIRENLNVSDYDIVLTTSNPFSTLFVGYYLKREYGLPWVADLRDPWCENDYINRVYRESTKNSRKMEEALEKSLLSLADRITVPSDGMIDDLDKYGFGKMAVCLPNGYDEKDFLEYEKVSFNKFTICYTGTVYGSRNPFLLLDILNGLIESGKIDSDKTQWVINGNLGARTIQMIETRDKYGIMVLNGIVSHKESIAIASASNMLVSLGEYDEGAYLVWTGKIFEYFRTCVPILSFSSHFGVQHDALMELNQGITVLPEETDRIEDFVLDLYNDWLNKSDRKWGNIEKAKRFDRRNITKGLAKEFDKILD